MTAADAFDGQFAALMGCSPFGWQNRLFQRLLDGDISDRLDLPTGLGKTSVMAIWYLALQAGARLPWRLVYVVDRRAVVDQATSSGRFVVVGCKFGIDCCHLVGVSLMVRALAQLKRLRKTRQSI